MLSAGAGVIVANLNPLGGIIEAGFNIRGVILIMRPLFPSRKKCWAWKP